TVPSYGPGGPPGEPPQGIGIGGGAAMIAGQPHPAPAANVIQASKRVAAVADDVAKADDVVDTPEVRDHRLQGRPVGVYVGDDRDPHVAVTYCGEEPLA